VSIVSSDPYLLFEVGPVELRLDVAGEAANTPDALALLETRLYRREPSASPTGG
jgi:hypothetical protein